MEFVSVPRSALASRWRPVSHAGAPPQQAWRPAAPSMAAPLHPTSLGQVTPVAAADVALDFLMSTGTALVGFGLAIFGPKDAVNWRWIGGLAGAIGTMRALHTVSKLGF